MTQRINTLLFVVALLVAYGAGPDTAYSQLLCPEHYDTTWWRGLAPNEYEGFRARQQTYMQNLNQRFDAQVFACICKFHVDYYDSASPQESPQERESFFLEDQKLLSRADTCIEAEFSLTVDPAVIAEAGGHTVATVDTGGATFLTAQTITLSLAGTARDEDYTIREATLTLPAGRTSVSTVVTATDDAVAEDDETIEITARHNGEMVGATKTIIIRDNDVANFSLTVDQAAIVEDGGNTTVTVDTGGTTFLTAQTITLSLAGTARDEDYTIRETTLTLPAGRTSVSTIVTATDDTVAEDSETIIITAQRDDTLVGETTITITDNDMAQFTLTVDTTTLGEDDGRATVMVSTGGVSFLTDQRITLSTGGTATEGEDYTVTKGLTLAAGQTSVSTTVTTTDDTVAEDSETIVITAQHAGEMIGETRTITVIDDDMAQFTLTADTTTLGENDGRATVMVSTGGTTFNASQTITLSLAGTATEGEDYTVTKELTLAAGQTSVSTTVTTTDDTVAEGDETIVITAQRDDTLVGETTITITDNDMVQFTLTVNETTIAEDGGETTVTVSTGGATFDTPQTITLSLAGIATEGEDYTVTKELTLAAGQTSVSTTVTTTDDTVAEGDETIVVTAQRGDTLAGETTITITDNDMVQFTLTVNETTIAEDGGETMVTVSTGGATFDTPQTITLSLTGMATEGEDYTVTKELTLAAGATSVSTTVTARNDTVDEDDETIVITAQHGGEIIGEPRTITVMDTEPEALPHEKEVVEDTVEAVVSSALSNVTTNIGTRFSAARSGTSVTVAGLPVAMEDSVSALAAFNDRSDPALHGEYGDDFRSQYLTLDRLLQTSAFQVSLAAADAQGAGPGPSLTVWGRVDSMFFDKESNDDNRYDGDLKAGYLGIDTWLDDRWLLGVAASITKVDAGYGLDSGGKLDLSIVGVHPYVRLALDDVSELWLILGLSRGKLQHLSKARSTPEDTDVTMYMGAAGVRRELTSIGGIDIALLGDAGFGSLRGGRGSDLPTIANLSADAWRARLGFSGSHTVQLEGLATFTPFVEIVGRYDGGSDGNTGLEIAGGLQYANPVSGLGLEIRANVLPLYSEDDYREYGFSISASASPGIGGEGLAMAVATSLGPQTGSTAALWRENLLGPANASDNLAESLALNAEIGYGFPVVGSKGVLTPFGGFRLRNGGGQQMRTGVRFGQMVSARPWNLELSGEQRTSDVREPEYLVNLLGRVRF